MKRLLILFGAIILILSFALYHTYETKNEFEYSLKYYRSQTENLVGDLSSCQDELQDLQISHNELKYNNEDLQGNLDDQQNCQDEVIEYQDKLADYQECFNDEQLKNQQEIADYNTCIAEGSSYCSEPYVRRVSFCSKPSKPSCY